MSDDNVKKMEKKAVSQWGLVVSRYKRNKLAIAGLVIFGIILIIIVSAPLFIGRIQPTSATPPYSVKTSAGVLYPKYFIGIPFIFLTSFSIPFCSVKLQLCFLGKYLLTIPFRFSMLPFSQL
jgi:hypothetical protein